MRQDPIYHSTYTGRPPDEPAVLGVALNEVFVPILQKQFPEIIDFYLPPEGCSYRMAVVTMKKQYPGHAKRVMMGVWSFLRQFMYTKFVLVCDEEVNARDWSQVTAAMCQHMAPLRDSLLIENTPIDSLDFASPVAGLGSKMGLDITKKWPAELALSVAEDEQSSSQQDIEAALVKLKQLFPEIIDIYLQNNNAGMIILSINKQTAENSRNIMQQIWQLFAENKFVIVCDNDVNVSDWNDIIWAITTRMDPARDTLFSQNQAGHSKLGFDATNKWPSECLREWGTPIKKDPEVVAKIDAIWDELAIFN